MPKVATPVTLKQTDVITLNSIISDNSFAGEDIKKRAKALLMLSEGKQVKAVAAELGFRENTVTEIRRRFEASGIVSLEDRQRSGRPVKYDPAEARTKIAAEIEDCKKQNKGLPSVKELSDKLSLPVPLVRSIYHELGLLGNRRHSWDFKTSDGLTAKNVEVVGLYLSSEQQALILRAENETSSQPEQRERYSYRLVTKERALAEKLSEQTDENNCLKIAQAVDLYVQNNKTAAPREKNDLLENYLKETIEDLSRHSEGTAEYHVFIHGQSPDLAARSFIPNIRTHESMDLEQWRLVTENIVNVLSIRSNDYDAGISFCNGIDRYLDHADKNTAAFRWSKYVEGAAKAELDQKKPESTECPSVSAEDVAPGTVKVVASIMGDDGNWISYESQNAGRLSQEAFKTDSEHDFLNSFDVIEQTIVKTTRQAAKGINERYMSELNKKKH